MVDFRSRTRDRDTSDDRGERSSRSRGDDDRGSRGRGDDDNRSSRGGGERSSFRYQGRTAAQMEKRAKMRSNEFDRLIRDGIKSWTPKDGANIIRILPPTWSKPDHYGIDLYVHYQIGPDKQAYLDLTKMKEQPDPISEERAEALRSGDDEYAKELESKRRCGVYIIDRDNEKEGVQFWAMPWTIDADLNKISVDRRTGEVMNIDDPDEGFDVEFDKTGKGIGTKYSGVAIARRSSPLGSQKWLDWAIDNPLPDQLTYFDYEHIAKAFGGGGSHRGRENEREERSREDGRGNERGGRAVRDGDDQARGRERDTRTRGESDSRDSRDSRGGSRAESGDSRDSGRRSDSRDSDRDTGRSSHRDEPSLTWESIHELTIEELEALCESEEALQEINPAKADGRADLADWICEELKIRKPEASTGRRRIETQDNDETHLRNRERESGRATRGDDDDSAAKLRRMREERSR